MRYNPFKAHVVEHGDGTYSVRKLTIWGWMHLGRDNDFWWSSTEHVRRWATLRNLDEAMRLCATQKPLKVVFQ